MSEEQLKELQEYNLEYLEAQQSEEIFGGDYTSAVELKYAKKEIERLNNIINELEKDLIEYFKKEYPDRKLEDYNLENCTYDYALVILGRLQELKGSNSN